MLISKEINHQWNEIQKQLTEFADGYMKWVLTKFMKDAANLKKQTDKSDHFSEDGLNSKSLGIQPVGLDEFIKNKKDAILNGSDAQLMSFAANDLNYKHSKDLISLVGLMASM